MFKAWLVKIIRLFSLKSKQISDKIEQSAKDKITKQLLDVIENAGNLGLIKKFDELDGEHLSLGIQIYASTDKSYISLQVGQALICSQYPLIYKITTNLKGYDLLKNTLAGGKN